MSTSTGIGDSVTPGPQPSQPDHGHRHLGIALLVIATAQLMIVLDGSIVNIALPRIQEALDFTPANLTWVINGYTLAFGGLLLLGGRAGDLFGRRRVFVFGILLFTVASLLCGLATSEAFLIGARVLQGVGAAVAAPTALALITTTFPEGQPRNRAFAIYAAMSGAGAAVGLIAGGLLTDYLDWRWVFFVNVPIGLLLAFAAPRVLGESEPETGKIDYLGALVGTVGLTSLVYGITRAANPEHGWDDTGTISCFVIAVVLLVGFVLIERRHVHPIMPLHLFANRNRSGSYVVMLLVGAALFSQFYFISLFVQGILQYSPVKAGLAFMPFTVGIVFGAGLASQLAQRLAPRVLAGSGLALATVGMFMFSQLEPTSAYWPDLLVPMIFISIGMGLVFVPMTLTAVAGVERHEAGIASAVLNTMQQVGGSLGLAALATIAANATNNAFQGAAEIAQGAAAGHAPPDPSVMPQVIGAVTDGYTNAFLVAAFMMIAAMVVTVVAVNAPKQSPDAEDQPAAHLG
ncbi:MAG TPA: MFS transporter [Jiangellaceae bacterium]